MTLVGGGYRDAAKPSETLYANSAYMPGIEVAAPSNPYNLKGMMISAIRDDNPVVFMLHKSLQALDVAVDYLPK